MTFKTPDGMRVGSWCVTAQTPAARDHSIIHAVMDKLCHTVKTCSRRWPVRSWSAPLVIGDTLRHTRHVLSHAGSAVIRDKCCYTRQVLSHAGSAVTRDKCCHTRQVLLHATNAVTREKCCYTREVLPQPTGFSTGKASGPSLHQRRLHDPQNLRQNGVPNTWVIAPHPRG